MGGGEAGASLAATLPAEMLERVFNLLPPRDLKAVVLVCRWWREVAEAPWLWAWVVVPGVVVGTSLARVTGMLGSESRRLPPLTRLEVRVVTEELLQAFILSLDLREVSLRQCELGGAGPEVLAQALAGRQVVSLRDRSWLSPAQDLALCQALVASPCALRRLDLWENELSSVEPELLARAVATLEEVNLGRTGLTREQGEAIFAALAGTGSSLRKLFMSENNLSSVEPGVMARAVNGLASVTLKWNTLTGEQVNTILAASLEGTRLTDLWVVGYEGGVQVDKDLVTRAKQVIPSFCLI